LIERKKLNGSDVLTMADAFDLFLPLVEKQSAVRPARRRERDVGGGNEGRDFKALKEGEEKARYREGGGGQPGWRLARYATTSVVRGGAFDQARPLLGV